MSTKGTLTKIFSTYSFAYLGVFSGLAYAGTYAHNNLQHEHDSIYHAYLKASDTNERLSTLQALSLQVRQTPQELQYLYELLGVANQVDSTSYVHWAVSALARNHANESRLDSVSYWVAYIDSITKDIDKKPDAFFSTHNSLCRTYIFLGKYELAMNEAIQQQIRSKRSNNKLGQVYSLENLGLIYFSAGRLDKMILPLEQCLDILDKEFNTHPQLQVQIIETLIFAYMKERLYDKAEISLNHMSALLNQIEKSTDNTFKTFPVDEVRCILYSHYARLYVDKGERAQALDASRKADSYWKDTHNNNTRCIYFWSKGYYYYSIHQYPNAINSLNQINSPEYIFDFYELKINAFRSMGNKQSAMATYQQLLDVIKSMNAKAYSNQVDQIQSLRSLSEKEKAHLESESQQMILQQQQSQLLYLIIGSVALLILLGILIQYTYRILKLRKVLEQEKNALHEINQNLRLAKEKAEKNNQTKVDFLINMNHQISAPLNAIVGFSELLDKATEEEQREYVRIISQNTEILLKHVDGVLKLSPEPDPNTD